MAMEERTAERKTVPSAKIHVEAHLIGSSCSSPFIGLIRHKTCPDPLPRASHFIVLPHYVRTATHLERGVAKSRPDSKIAMHVTSELVIVLLLRVTNN